MLDFGSVRVFEPRIRRAYRDLARALLAHDDAGIAAATVALGFVAPGDDPSPLVRMMHIVCEPLERDVAFDPRAYDVMERAGRVTQLAFEHRLFRTPGHQVFLFRSLIGLDAYLKALGATRNWHRLFRDIVQAIHDPPPSPRRR
jgi:predicted unusual protein kinase regulating ubiquinone biosynthesis (AarF/ABC1/UbiB family)